MVSDDRVVHQGGDDRCRIGEPRRLDDQAVEGRYNTALAPVIEISDGVAEIASDRAAETAALQQHRRIVESLEQMVIEPDLAELVDEHCRIAKLRRRAAAP